MEIEDYITPRWLRSDSVKRFKRFHERQFTCTLYPSLNPLANCLQYVQTKPITTPSRNNTNFLPLPPAQFARQAQYLSERENPIYTPLFKASMRYIPLAMRLYRFKHYFDMERDYAGFNIESGRPIRQSLAQENEAYVKRTAPRKYWDALIPKTEIGCKRKVLDTEYLKSLWRENVELVSDDPVERITESGVVTRSGREIGADAIVLAIGFATQQMLSPVEIVGREGLGLNDYVSRFTMRKLLVVEL